MPADTLDRPKVIVADPDDDARYIFQTVLAHRGMEVVAVATGDEALEALKHGGAAAVVCELYLPTDGYQTLVQAMRASTSARTTPVVICTTRVRPDDFASARDFNCAALLEKPAMPLQVALEVERTIRQKTGAERATAVAGHAVSGEDRPAPGKRP